MSRSFVSQVALLRLLVASLAVFSIVGLAGCPETPATDAGDTPVTDAPMADATDAGSDTAFDGALDAPSDGGGLDGGADGGMPPMELVITTCPGDALPSLSSGEACEITAAGPGLLITADILTPGEVFRGGQVLIDATGTISCVGCDCTASAAGASTLSCPDGVLSPGLINAHEHLTFQGQPYTDTGERYEHRHDWRRGLRGHTEITAPGSASTNAMLWAELRMVMGGATSINGSGSANGFLRNLDRASSMEGLGQPQVDYDTFPLGDSGGALLTSGCAYPMINTTAAISSIEAYTPHLSEGIDRAARNEFLCVAPGGFAGSDLIEPQTALIHGVGLGVADIFAIREGNSMLIWSPRSNVTLYGDTARAPEYHRLGVPIALGTDWIYSGSMNLLRELSCADDLNTDYFDGYFEDEDLWLMATHNGAQATGTDDVLGRIATGLVADLAIFDARASVDHRAVIDAQPDDVVLVLRSGRPLYGASSVVAGLPGGNMCETMDVCGAARRVCAMGETGMGLSALSAANASAYPLFFCGAPVNEPSCHPRREPISGLPNPVVNGSTTYSGMITATDGDGDGIADAMDLCPSVFDPIRPLDDGAQPDFDLDGLGDACDPCPFDVTSACALPNPDDRDADGVLDATDNCPGLANPDQADDDSDGRGDACDACPMAANPGTAPCPATIYDIKDGTFPVGQRVAIANAIVTARISNGFFVQVKEGDAGYVGPDFSGLFVFTGGAPTIALGDRVDVSGTIQDFFGQLQISMSTATVVVSAAEALPAPIVVTPAQVGTGGARAAALEGVLVTVEDVAVTALNTTFNEFTVDGSLVVDDAAFLLAPLPTVGQRYLSLTGVLAFRNSASKLLPRSAADAIGTLLSFGPTLSYLAAGASGVASGPAPLTARLERTSTTDTFIAIASGDPTALTVVDGGVTIPAGMLSAPVLLNGLLESPGVTLTATLAAEMATATVRVVGAAEVPSLADMVPGTATLPVGGTQTLRVDLDLPAPVGGTVVTLALAPASAGTIPATVTVPAGMLSAAFEYVDAGTTSDATVTATLGASMVSATLTMTAGAGELVINEIDYDQIGSDGTEFIELYNGGSFPVALDGLAVFLVNGSAAPGASYARFDLTGTLPPGGYLVLSNATFAATLPPATASVVISGTVNLIQNGAPDGVILIRVATAEVIDALSYEGELTMSTLMGVPGAFRLVEGAALAATVADSNDAVGSLCRTPNGSDTDQAVNDWAFTSTPTPGAANVP